MSYKCEPIFEKKFGIFITILIAVYAVVAGAVFLSITILCTGIIIIMAVLVYKYKTFHHRSPNVGYPNALSELDGEFTSHF